MSSIGAALGAAFMSTARAEASRINGAKSRGPKTALGKARSAQNALKHGLRAERFTVVGDEDEDVYDAHEQALLAELAPEGALQTLLAERIARAAWRLARADCIEATLFDRLADIDGDLGLAVIRDGHGTRAFETLLRYRGAAQAELLRALRTLKALQAEAAQAVAAVAPAPVRALVPAQAQSRAPENPIEPEARANPGGTVPLALAAPPDEAQAPGQCDAAAQPGAGPCRATNPPAGREQACRGNPDEPEDRRNPDDAPREIGDFPTADGAGGAADGGRGQAAVAVA